MSRRTNIIAALIDSLVDQGVVLRDNITRRLVFLHEVNDFPSICMTAGSESRFHYGANQRLAQLSVDLRGFIYDEDAVGNAEAYARSIEVAVDAYASSHYDIGLREARVLSLRTDEGLFEPHGIIDMTIQITYEVQT